MKKLILVLSVCLSAFAAQAASSFSLDVEWDPSPSTNVVGYWLYYGTGSRTYSASNAVGNMLTCTLTNLLPGKTYFFTVTARDQYGIESDYSNEISHVAPAVPGRFRIKTTLQASASPTGGWEPLGVLESIAQANETGFFRAVLAIEPEQ